MAGESVSGAGKLPPAIVRSLGAVKRLTREAANAGGKLVSGERILSPAEDSLSYTTSRTIRADVEGLKRVAETGQLQISALQNAIAGLDRIGDTLGTLRSKVLGSAASNGADTGAIQAEIDQLVAEIDAAAREAKLGGRSLLDGSSTIRSVRSINAAGRSTPFRIDLGQSIAQAPGVQEVRVNRLGAGGPVRLLDDGRRVLSLNVSVIANQRPRRAFLSLSPGTAGSFAEFRVTGRLGSTTLRLVSTEATAADVFTFTFNPAAFNEQSQDTGVVFSGDAPTTNLGLVPLGFRGDEFIKVELLAFDHAGGTAARFSNFGAPSTHALGATAAAFNRTGFAYVNGALVELSGEYGNTVHYKDNGFDIEIDVSTFNLDNPAAASTSDQINILLDQGNAGLLDSGSNESSTVTYGIRDVSANALGRSPKHSSVTVARGGRPSHVYIPGAAFSHYGNKQLGVDAVADLASGGKLDLDSGRLKDALRVIDRAVSQTVAERARLGNYQTMFMEAVSRAETKLGNLASADADIIGVDAASEIANLVQAQAGIGVTTSMMSTMTAIQGTIFGLLRP
ncbi:MAG: hypothetical protein HUU29_09185 [Planctomycetaceae bacterium]|nr:hypothetical protein [Planctomycetaceae bacterium]